jgi:hypothetical protein
LTRSQPIFETRLAWGYYFAPIVLTGGAVALLIAWIVLNLVDADRPGFMGPLMAALGVVSLVIAGVWAWGGRRGRIVVSTDELTLTPPMGRAHSVDLSDVVSVDLRRLPGSAARAMFLTDGDGRTVQIGIGAWEREIEILRLIGDAARRTSPAVTPEAQEALSKAAQGLPLHHTQR